jgi:hypothetical protein
VLTLQNLQWSQGLIDFGRQRSTFALLRDIVGRAAEVARSTDSRFLFVYLPCEQRFTTRIAHAEAESYRLRVLSGVGELGLKTLDVTPVFARQPHPRSLFRGHYTPTGNALVADAVLAALGVKPSGANP